MTEDVQFIKRVPVHPRDRLKRKTQKLSLIHPRDPMKKKVLQIAAENAEAITQGKFNFAPEKILNKNLIFGTSRISEEKIMEKITESLSADNDELYIEHERGTNLFPLKG